MTTPMRWADSDSDDSDDEYNVNEESSKASNDDEAPLSSGDTQQSQANNAPRNLPSRDAYNSKYRNDNKGHRNHEQQNVHKKNKKNGGNGGNYGGGGKNRSQHAQHGHKKNRGGPGPENWKQLAKASSRFSSGM